MPSIVNDSPVQAPISTRLPTDIETITTGYQGYDHVHWFVGNAKQAATYYVTRFGFKYIAYRGLETGSRYVCSYVVGLGDIRFVITSPIQGPDKQEIEQAVTESGESLRGVHQHLAKHGDSVKDVAFEVDDVDQIWSKAVQNGGKSVKSPTSVSDESGSVRYAIVQTYGDTIHTLMSRADYRGAFLPGYRAVTSFDPISLLLPKVPLRVIDHCVGNQDWDEMEKMCN